MTKDNFPLSDKLTLSDTTVQTPKYLLENPYLDLTACFPDHPDSQKLQQVDVINHWPQSGVTTSMDTTQLRALHRILTKELAIVQGPPGTGKTFTSVRAL